MQKNQTSGRNASAFTKCFGNVYVNTLRKEQNKKDFCVASLKERYAIELGAEAHVIVQDAYEHFFLLVGNDSRKWWTNFIDCCKGLAESQGIEFCYFLRYLRTMDFFVFRQNVADKYTSFSTLHLN